MIPQLFLDYASVIEEAPRLLKSVLKAGPRPDPHEASTLSELARMLPRAIQLLPSLFPDKEDVQQIAVLGDMLSELHNVAGLLRQAGYVSHFINGEEDRRLMKNQIARPHVSPLMVDGDRLHLLQAAAFDSFERSLHAVTAAA